MQTDKIKIKNITQQKYFSCVYMSVDNTLMIS